MHKGSLDKPCFYQLKPEFEELTAISYLNGSDSSTPVCITPVYITYRELHTLVEQLAKRVSGVSPFDNKQKLLVMIECSNHVSVIVSYLFCLRYGHAALMVDAEINVEYRQELIERYRPNLSLTHGEKEGLLPTVEVINDQTTDMNADLAVLLSTSGSTGSPKQVRLSYKNLQANADSICEYLSIDQNERAITSLPLFYSYGLSVLNSHLNSGAQLILTQDSIVSKDFWNCFKILEATSFAGVPHQYKTLSQIRFERMDLPSLKTMTQAGGKLSEALTQQFCDYAQSKNLRFFVMYGQTEATARMSYIPSDLLPDVIGSIGIAIPGGRFSLEGEDGQTVDVPNQEGELVYQGDNVMMGYATSIDDLSKGAELTCLKTGDLAYRNQEGFYFISGRKNRMAKVFGLRVDLFQLEERLKQVTHHNVACVEVNDHIYICIESRAESSPEQKNDTTNVRTEDVKIVDNYLRDKLKLHSSAYAIKLIETLPRTANGKMAYGELTKSLDNNN